MQQLLKLTAGSELASGIFPGQPGESPFVWADGRNVDFSSGLVSKAKGKTGLANLAARPRGMKATLADTEPRLYVGAGTEWYRYRSSDGLTNIGSVASSGGTWVIIPWGVFALGSNGVDTPELWQNSGTSSPIVAPFTRANTLVKYRNQVFAMGTSNGGTAIESCEFDDITSWTPTLTNTVFADYIRDLNSDIVSAHILGDSVGVYTRAEMGLLSYVGGTAVFGFRKQLDGIGALSHYSIVPVGRFHYGITRDQVFVCDGVSARSLEDASKKPVSRWIAGNINWDRMSEVYGWHERGATQVRWVLPVGSSGFLTLAFNYETGTWTFYDDDTVCGEESGVFPYSFAATTSRLLRLDRETENEDGVALESWVYSKPVDFGTRNSFKRYGRIDLDLEWSGDVFVDLAYLDEPNETPVWGQTFSAARQIFPDRESVFMSIRIRSNSVGASWVLNGIEVWGEGAGYVG